jgi:hypothetical protein
MKSWHPGGRGCDGSRGGGSLRRPCDAPSSIPDADTLRVVLEPAQWLMHN